MLQQTQVATVLDYYRRFMQRFPSVAALAEADESAVLHAWQGLGYYSRARNLQRAARAVVELHDGQVPDDVALLRILPGIGPYSAGAIASIAFGHEAPILDGNVTRVLCRFFGLRGDPARAPLKAELWALAEALIPDGKARDFNQAMMEIGAICCTAKTPLCQECPLRARCVALIEQQVAALPETAARPAITPQHHVAAVIERRGRYLILQLSATAPRWAGMWQFPTGEVKPSETAEHALERAVRELTGLSSTPRELITAVKHSVTRYRITLDVYRCSAATGHVTPRGHYQAARWARLEELSALALPIAHRRIARSLAAND